MLIFQTSSQKSKDSEGTSWILTLIPKKNDKSKFDLVFTPGGELSTKRVKMIVGGGVDWKIDPGNSFFGNVSMEMEPGRTIGEMLQASLDYKTNSANYFAKYYANNSAELGVGNDYLSWAYGLKMDGSEESGFLVKGAPGDVYTLVNDYRNVMAGNGGVFGYVKAGLDGVLSLVQRAIEWFSSNAVEDLEGKVPSAEDLSAVKGGRATWKQCVTVLGWKDAGNEENQEAVKSAARQLEHYTLGELYKGTQAEVPFRELESIEAVLEKNNDYLSANGWAQIRTYMDRLRISIRSFEMLQRSGGLTATINNIYQSMGGNEWTIGIPPKLTWNPLEIITGLFDNTEWFKHVSENKGVFGKIGGFFEDIWDIATKNIPQIVKNAVLTFSPVYNRSDARYEDMRKNVKDAMEENERLLSPSTIIGIMGNETDETRKIFSKAYSNMLYMTEMMGMLYQAGEESLAGKIGEHIKKHELFYELISSKTTRDELNSLFHDIESGEIKKDSPLWDAMQGKIREDLSHLLQAHAGLALRYNELRARQENGETLTEVEKLMLGKLEEEVKGIVKLIAAVKGKQAPELKAAEIGSGLSALPEFMKKYGSHRSEKLYTNQVAKEIAKVLPDAISALQKYCDRAEKSGKEVDPQVLDLLSRSKELLELVNAKEFDWDAVQKQVKELVDATRAFKPSYGGQDWSEDMRGVMDLVKALNPKDGRMDAAWERFVAGNETDDDAKLFNKIAEYSKLDYRVIGLHLKKWAANKSSSEVSEAIKKAESKAKDALDEYLKSYNNNTGFGDVPGRVLSQQINKLLFLDTMFPGVASKADLDYLMRAVRPLFEFLLEQVPESVMKDVRYEERYARYYQFAEMLLFTLSHLKNIEHDEIDDWIKDDMPKATKTLYNIYKTAKNDTIKDLIAPILISVRDVKVDDVPILLTELSDKERKEIEKLKK